MYLDLVTYQGTDRRHVRLNSLGIASAKRHTKWTTTNSNASNCCDPNGHPDASACCGNCWHVYASNSCISVENVVVAVAVVAAEVVVVVATAPNDDVVAVADAYYAGDDDCCCDSDCSCYSQ